MNYKIEKVEDRLFFHDGEKYVLLDTGFVSNPCGKNSVSVNGRIGQFSVGSQEQSFFDRVINLTMKDGKSVSAVFNPMDGYNCLLKGETLTISDEEIDLGSNGTFFPFADPKFPIIEGSMNGTSIRFFFDCGARMTMFGEKSLVSQPTRTYREWLALLSVYADLPVYKLSLEFPNGFKYEGEGALVDHPAYQGPGKLMGIRAMLGIDIFEHYDLLMTFKGKKRGIELFEKK